MLCGGFGLFQCSRLDSANFVGHFGIGQMLCARAALSNVHEDNVVSTVRVFKSLKDKPVMDGMWASLLDSLNRNKDMLSVLLIGV